MSKHFSIIYQQKGITLAEVLISLVIFSILLLTVFQFFIASQKHTTNNTSKTVATYLAQGAIEQLQLSSLQTTENITQQRNKTIEKSYFPPDLKQDFKNNQLKKEYSYATCKTVQKHEDDCHFYNANVNNKDYQIKILLLNPNSANNEEKLNLIPIEIHTHYSKNQYVVIEGYVKK
ncbi:type IV pilus modification PilV family protein [Massilibacterium senegalense]|uniref:type IV pilus modification PilV family protein n=1 Tax=Massilibacterium senegalense TaxID=1632858 RepID=UPI0007811406|nr:type II secretion system protein [Massilibacterium senegalense]